MPIYNGVSITINVDGQPLSEYQLQVDEATKEATCWIPSYTGKEFSIIIHNTTRSVQMKASVKMDGQSTNIRRVGPRRREIVDRCRPSPTTYRTFIFSPGQLVDNDELSLEALNVTRVGVIQVSVHEGLLDQIPSLTVPGDYREIKIPDKRMIPERKKKGIEECISLGPTQSRPIEKQCVRLDSFRSTGRRAKITFRYRPLAFLQAQGIAPPDSVERDYFNTSSRKRKEIEDNPRPVAGPSKTPKISAPQETLKEVIKFDISKEEDLEKLRALWDRIDKPLAEKGPSAAQVKKEVKQEPRPLFLKGEVIGLT
ncbi:hypothetical protein D9756_004524 [Leucocoprinus leucothites]|uniref:DUF7918 domain-containing protein n=1 Tax=Leucocoprinus leucothites TaxID=201217 RepID=A0A8H5G8V4_9AGAR|nr:hypothetical protein D9756_004524 [Leucoagaricus leucothites]